MADLDAWDADDFEPELPSRQADPDKWEGEDEDDGTKGNWEDEDEGDKKEPVSEGQAYQRPKKKPIGERLAEKEAQEKQEQEEKKLKQKEDGTEMTAEEKQAEKERIKKIKEQESLKLAKGLFADNADTFLDDMRPESEAEFDKFGEVLKNKIQSLEDHQLYTAFVVQLINELSLTLGVDEVKKLGVSVNSLYHEKERQRKETEKKKKKKSKASIKVDRADDLDLIGDATGGRGGAYYDDDDFI